MQDKLILTAVLAQTAALLAFTLEFIASVFGVPGLKFSWAVHEIIELSLVASMLIGFVIGGKLFWDMRTRTRKVEEQLAYASASFHQLLLAKFEEWGLTQAEQDNAILIVKGFSVSEMAALREKAKAPSKPRIPQFTESRALAGRAQFVSFFLEELTADL